MIQKIDLLGSCAAIDDVARGTVLSRAEVAAIAARLWPPGKEPSRCHNTGRRGHRGCGSLDSTFWCWDDLRREYVENYMAALEAERAEAHAYACRH